MKELLLVFLTFSETAKFGYFASLIVATMFVFRVVYHSQVHPEAPFQPKKIRPITLNAKVKAHNLLIDQVTEKFYNNSEYKKTRSDIKII